MSDFQEEGQEPASEEAVEDPSQEQQEPKESKYWADKPVADMGDELADVIQAYYQTLRASGMIDLYRNIHSQFYGLSDTGAHETSQIVEFGDDGEKLGVRVNHLRALVRYMHNTATADRPLLLPKAINTTAKALSQVPTARRIMDYYMKRGKLEANYKSTILRALLYGKAYLWQTWDPSLGPITPNKPDPKAPVGTPPDPPTPQGELVYKACGPLDVICDLEREAGDHDWLIVRRTRNKYDAAAVYAMPNDEFLTDKILNSDKDVLENAMCASLSFGLHRALEKDGDTLYEYHFMHRRTPAMPHGRYIIMIGAGLIAFEGPLPFTDMPIDECIPEQFLEAGSLGYASAWDLIGMQQAYNAVVSTCITSFDAYGHNDMLLA